MPVCAFCLLYLSFLEMEDLRYCVLYKETPTIVMSDTKFHTKQQL